MTKLKFEAPKRARKTKPAKASPAAVKTPPPTKLAMIKQLLRRPEGAQMGELMAATGWQAHSVRGALSGAIKKQLNQPLVSEKSEAGRVYRILVEIAE